MQSRITTLHRVVILLIAVMLCIASMVQGSLICDAVADNSSSAVVTSESKDGELSNECKSIKEKDVEIAYTVGTDYGLDDEVSNNAIISDYGICDVNDVGIRYKYIDGVLMKYMGKFKTTHYCSCSTCCGPGASGITASGRAAEVGVSIAVDRRVIPLGKKVYLSGYGMRRADDTGGGIKRNKIDIFVGSHSEALQMGVRNNIDVWVEV